jgi:hypothetical protein
MALPTLVKDYQVIANQTIAGDATIDSGTNSHRDRRNLMMAIKNQLVASGTSDVGPTPGGAITPWVVEYSCDGSTAGSAGDNVDRWTDANTDLIWNTSGNAHSWMVLSQAGLGIEICIDLIQNSNSNDGAELIFVVSAGAGFTGGSTTARPTATDELWLRDTNAWGSGANGGGAHDYVWHMWRSEDGEATALVIHYADNPLGFWYFGAPQSPSSGWSGTQFIATVMGENSDTTQVLNPDDFYLAASMRTYRSNRLSTANPYNITTLYLSADTFGGGDFMGEFTVDNDITGEYALGVMGLVSLESNFRGRMGSVFDLYWGQNVLGQPFDTYPSGGAKNWVQFGAFVFPWDGATPVTT